MRSNNWGLLAALGAMKNIYFSEKLSFEIELADLINFAKAFYKV